MLSEPALEDRLLGGILVGLARQWPAAEPALTTLEARHFRNSANKHVFATIADLRRDRLDVDLVSTAERLVATQLIEEAGGFARLAELWDVACGPVELPAFTATVARRLPDTAS